MGSFAGPRNHGFNQWLARNRRPFSSVTRNQLRGDAHKRATTYASRADRFDGNFNLNQLVAGGDRSPVFSESDAGRSRADSRHDVLSASNGMDAPARIGIDVPEWRCVFTTHRGGVQHGD